MRVSKLSKSYAQSPSEPNGTLRPELPITQATLEKPKTTSRKPLTLQTIQALELESFAMKYLRLKLTGE